MSITERVPLSPGWTEILKHSRAAFSYAVNGKFGCTAVIHNVESDTASSFSSKKWTFKPEKKYSKQLRNGVTVSVWKDDLTTHVADAVVNAANERLDHGGGLALALSRAGGPEIQQMSDQIIKSQKLVPTGEVVFTPAGKLPYKCIIHAVGPCVSLNPSRAEVASASNLLKKTILNILRHTDYNNLQSVAIPAISSGLFNFPRDACADIIVSTLMSFKDVRHPQSGSLEIRLVNNDDPSVQEMLRACRELLGPSDSQSGAMQIQSNALAGSSAAMQIQSNALARSTSSVELGNVTLHLKKGPIEQETTDIIVNTIAHDLDLSQGHVSKAILKKAGPNIQNEIKTSGFYYPPQDHVFETSGHKLHCKAVYHIVCPGRSFPSACETLQRIITRCLEKAETRNISSMSFPAIGTGNLGFKKEEVSQIMIRAVVEFARKHKGNKMDVYFVIFPKDTDIFKAFEMEMDSIKKKQNVSQIYSSTTGKSSVFYGHEENRATAPFIELLAHSDEAITEAKAWAMRILDAFSNEITINNNHVIQFGQKDHEKLMSLQARFSVFITEFFSDGKCGLKIIGEPKEVSSVVLHVEAMLCQAQEDFAQAEENDLLRFVVSEELQISATSEKAYSKGADRNDQNAKPYYAKTLVDKKSYDGTLNEKIRKFRKCGLEIVKMEKMENNALKQVFELNKKRVPGQPQRLYQRVTSQFGELICRVGFQRDYAPPKEQKYGAGIYFTTEVKEINNLWQNTEEEYVYIIEAQVLTGNDTLGSPQMIMPPPLKFDPQAHYDSVTNRTKDLYVIFHGQQAIPEYLITCKPVSTRV